MDASIHRNPTITMFSIPVLVGGAGGIKPRPHQGEGQVEVLQVEREGLPGCPVCFVAPLTLDLHGDWTLSGSENPKGIPLAQMR